MTSVFSCVFIILGERARVVNGRAQLLLDLPKARIMSVKNPEPGLWRLKVVSGGPHTTRITGLSAADFNVRFSKKASRENPELRPLAGMIPHYCFVSVFRIHNFSYLYVAKHSNYYMLRSSLQIQRSALLDDWTSRAHYLTPCRTCWEGFYQNYSHYVFRLFIVTEYNFTISVTKFALFRSLETVLVQYNLIIRVLYFNAHVTCIHSNTCSRFDMIEPLDKTLPDFKSPATDFPSSNTAERIICRLDRNV